MDLLVVNWRASAEFEVISEGGAERSVLEEDGMEREVFNGLSILFTIVLVIGKIGFGVGGKDALEIFKFKISGLLLKELLNFLEVTLEDKGLADNFAWMQTDLLKLFFIFLLF